MHTALHCSESEAGPVTVRRLIISWVLSLLLVFAQQGAVLHEIGHLTHSAADVPGVAPVSEQQPSQNAFCPACEAFAQVASAAPAPLADVEVTPAAIVPIPERSYPIIGADAPTARSRGPPQS